jgi:hypothetical protein
VERSGAQLVMERNARFARISSARAALALAVMLASFPAMASCGVNARSGDGSQPAGARIVAEQTTNQKAAGEPVSWRGSVARAGDARAGYVEARAKDGGETKSTGADSEDSSRKVTLEIRGERGTRFSGKCSIGGEERRIGGRVPESYSYALGGKKLECEIRKDGPGALQVVLAAGDDVRSVHRQAGAGSGIIRLTYSGEGASGVSSSQSQISSTLDSSTKSR